MISILKDESPMLISSVDDVTYLGFPDHTQVIGKNRPVWGIKKIWIDNDGDTVIGFANGSNMKAFVWNDREDYVYSNFIELEE